MHTRSHAIPTPFQNICGQKCLRRSADFLLRTKVLKQSSIPPDGVIHGSQNAFLTQYTTHMEFRRRCNTSSSNKTLSLIPTLWNVSSIKQMSLSTLLYVGRGHFSVPKDNSLCAFQVLAQLILLAGRSVFIWIVMKPKYFSRFPGCLLVHLKAYSRSFITV
jgi:hypothetical protein